MFAALGAQATHVTEMVHLAYERCTLLTEMCRDNFESCKNYAEDCEVDANIAELFAVKAKLTAQSKFTINIQDVGLAP
jgi:hypothetical protein